MSTLFLTNSFVRNDFTMTHHYFYQTMDQIRRLYSTDRKLKKDTNDDAKKNTTIYMETEHEMSNILTSDNKTTTEMQVV